ncbi:MAG: hypothetical protein ABIR63_07940 [Sphingomicrobium sp.]
MSRPLRNWEEVRDFALGLPGAEEGTYYGRPAIKAATNGRAVLTESREPGNFVLHIDKERKAMLLDIDPDRFWQTQHFENWPALLVRYGEDDGGVVAEWIERALELVGARPKPRPRPNRK